MIMTANADGQSNARKEGLSPAIPSLTGRIGMYGTISRNPRILAIRYISADFTAWDVSDARWLTKPGMRNFDFFRPMKSCGKELFPGCLTGCVRWVKIHHGAAWMMSGAGGWRMKTSTDRSHLNANKAARKSERPYPRNKTQKTRY